MLAPQSPHFRLVGSFEGRSLYFDLESGEHTVGSAGDNAICLPISGVSRRHAVIHAGPEGLRVVDLDSKNGTRVDGSRVLRAAAGDGSRLAFGLVELAVESIEEAASLAIRFEPTGAVDSSWPVRAAGSETSIVAIAERGVAPCLEPIDGLGDLLLAQADGEALRHLADRLGADGVALVQWSPTGEPLALARCGEPGPLPRIDQVKALPARSDFGGAGQNGNRHDGSWQGGTWRAGPIQGGTLVARFDAGSGFDSPVALWLWGAERAELAVLQIAAQLLMLAYRRPSDDPAPRRRYGEVELRFPPGYVLGASPRMKELYRQMATVCRLRSPVLLHGETGVGKELLARTLHDSLDASAPYEVVNCAAIPPELLEAEMFGVVQGAATGVEARRGHFARANGGTLFLDEIGELAPSLQAKLLRTLQEGEIQPVGGTPQPVDVRVVAATHVDLDSGALRRDLFYRLAVGLLEVPPLRRAREDIPTLVIHYLRTACDEIGIHLHGVTAGALDLLCAYDWPGNVRELASVMRRLAASSRDGDLLDASALPREIREPELASGSRPKSGPMSGPDPGDGMGSLALKPQVEALERRLIREAMIRSAGRQVEAAKRLGVSRSGLAKMLRRLDLKDSWARPSVGER